MIYLCIVYIMNSLLYTWYLHICVHQCLALSVAFCWLWPVTFAKGHHQQHFVNNKYCADAHVRWESQTWLWNSPCVFRYSMWSACEGFPSSWVWIWCEISSLEVWFWIRHSEVTTTSMTSSRCSVGPTVFFSVSQSMSMAFITTYTYIYIHTYLYLCFEWYLCSLLVHGKRSNAWR